MQTPHVLELPGVGNPATLQAAGLPVFHPLAGVGENYIDHFATRMNWRVKLPVTLNEAARGWRLGWAAARWFLTHKGILTLGTGLVHGFVKTRKGLESPDPGPAVSTDEAWLDFARRNGQTIYHAIGTCKMRNDPAAVVDHRLKVHGLQGLRVVDASIMPGMVSGNTQAAVFMIAEKGSELIVEDERRGA